MQIEKLFQVLVIGGALLSGGVMADTSVCPSGEFPQDASLADDQEGELLPIFCTQPDACVTSCSGEKTVKAGFVCCWGTSCDNS